MAKQIQVLPVPQIWVQRGGAPVVVPDGRFAGFRSHLGADCADEMLATPNVLGGPFEEVGAYESGDTVTLRVYPYVTRGGTKYFGPVAESDPVNIGQDLTALIWTWSPEPLGHAEGYRLIRNYNDAGFVEFVDVVAPETSFVDLNDASWAAGSTVTPVASRQLPQWTDQSGNARHLVQATAAQQPALIANQLNGFPAIRFDGVDDRMQVTFAGQTAFTVMAVVRCEAATRGLVQLGATVPYISRQLTRFGLIGPTSITTADGQPISPCLVTASRTGTVGTIRVNGFLYATGAVGLNGWDRIGLLTNAIISSGSIVDFFALDVWNTALSLPVIMAAEQALMTTYGIGLPAPLFGFRYTEDIDQRDDEDHNEQRVVET